MARNSTSIASHSDTFKNDIEVSQEGNIAKKIDKDFLCVIV